MNKPTYNGDEITQDVIDFAIANGLPEIAGQQAVAKARYAPVGGVPVNWYWLANSTEHICFDDGTLTTWPEV